MREIYIYHLQAQRRMWKQTEKVSQLLFSSLHCELTAIVSSHLISPKRIQTSNKNSSSYLSLFPPSAKLSHFLIKGLDDLLILGIGLEEESRSAEKHPITIQGVGRKSCGPQCTSLLAPAGRLLEYQHASSQASVLGFVVNKSKGVVGCCVQGVCFFLPRERVCIYACV